MQLTHDEVQQLKAAGFDATHIAEVQVAKAGALQGGADWAGLFNFLITNGPTLLKMFQTFAGLFGKTTVPSGDGANPPK